MGILETGHKGLQSLPVALISLRHMVHDVMIHSWDFSLDERTTRSSLHGVLRWTGQIRTWELTDETMVFLGRLLGRIRDIGKDQAWEYIHRIGIGQDDECQYLHGVEYWENSISYLY